jgi:hypothetical protein
LEQPLTPETLAWIVRGGLYQSDEILFRALLRIILEA